MTRPRLVAPLVALAMALAPLIAEAAWLDDALGGLTRGGTGESAPSTSDDATIILQNDDAKMTSSSSTASSSSSSSSLARLLLNLLLRVASRLDSVVVAACVTYVALAIARRRHARAMRQARSAMTHLRERDATCASVERGMMDWMNHALRHQWRSVIADVVDARARETMEEALREDARAASRGVVREASVAECSLGVVPPTLRLYAARSSPSSNHIQFEFDLEWQTVQSQIVVRAVVQPAKFVPAVRVPVRVTDLAIEGRVLIGFRLVDRAPGVGGVEVSFVGRPNVSVQVAPCGIALGDVPGVHEFIRGKIADALKEKYVEPRRFYKDVERAFLESGRDAAIASATGAGGALVVDVVSARGLAAPGGGSGSGGGCSPYVEVTFGGATRRTPTRANTTSPEFNHRVAFPLMHAVAPPPHDEPRLSRGGGGGGFGSPFASQRGMFEEEAAEEEASRDRGGETTTLTVRVMDWSPLSAPREIGAATYAVDVASFDRGAAARAGEDDGGVTRAREVELPLRRTRGGGGGGGGIVKLFIGRFQPPPGPGIDRGAAAAAASVATPTSASASASTGAMTSSFDGGTSPSPSSRSPRSPRSSAADGLGSAMTSNAEAAAAAAAAARSSAGLNAAAAGARGFKEIGAAATHLVQVAKMQKARREDAARHATELATARAETADAREDVVMERTRRDHELRRALVEGAVFYVHTRRKPGFEPGKYRLWYNASKKSLQWSEGRRPGGKTKLHQFVPASLVRNCVVGTEAFTLGAIDETKAHRLKSVLSRSPTIAKAAASVGVVQRSIGHHDPLRCFSVSLWFPDDAPAGGKVDNILASGAASLGLQTIDLELPDGGNGRSVREWCDAITAAALENGGGAGTNNADPSGEADVAAAALKHMQLMQKQIDLKRGEAGEEDDEGATASPRRTSSPGAPASPPASPPRSPRGIARAAPPATESTPESTPETTPPSSIRLDDVIPFPSPSSATEETDGEIAPAADAPSSVASAKF